MRRLLLAVLVCGLGPVLPAPAEENPLDPAEAPPAVRRAVFRAEVAHTRSETEEAVRLLAEALAGGEDRDHPALRYRLGAYLLELGRAREAVPHLERAGQQAPGAEAVWLDYARATYETGAYPTAAAAFARAWRLQIDEAQAHAGEHAEGESPGDHGSVGHGDHHHEGRGGFTAPEASAFRVAGGGHHQVDHGLMYYSAVAWILAEEAGRAVDILEPLVAAIPDTVPRAWVRALVSAAAVIEAPGRAEAGVRRLLRDHPDRPAVWSLASQQSQLQGDVPEAALRLQVSGWLSPLEGGEIMRLAELYGAAGSPRMAARRYARLWPADEDLARPLAVAWLRAHEPDSARVVLESALAAAPDAGLSTLLGDVEFETQRWEEARRAYREAVELDPALGRAWLMQGVSSLKLGDETGARASLVRAAEIDESADQATSLLEYLDAVASRR